MHVRCMSIETLDIHVASWMAQKKTKQEKSKNTTKRRSFRRIKSSSIDSQEREMVGAVFKPLILRSSPVQNFSLSLENSLESSNWKTRKQLWVWMKSISEEFSLTNILSKSASMLPNVANDVHIRKRNSSGTCSFHMNIRLATGHCPDRSELQSAYRKLSAENIH